MSIEMLPREDVVTVVETQDEPEIYHITCHCSDLKVAWCFEKDLEGEAGVEGEITACPMCMMVWEEANEKCPWGCDCGPENHKFFCGVHYDDDEDE